MGVGSGDDGFQGVTQLAGLGGVELHHETSAAFERNTHHDAAPLLGDFQRTVARPRLHRRHARTPSSLPATSTLTRVSATATPRLVTIIAHCRFGIVRSGQPTPVVHVACGRLDAETELPHERFTRPS